MASGRWLGADDFGDWIGVASRPAAYVFLIPSDSWWIGRHFLDGGWKLDVATPVQWAVDVVRTVDLALDVRRLHGATWIEDTAEFEVELRGGAIPPEFADPARTTARALHQDLSLGREPFAAVGEAWLRVAARLIGPGEST
jgi:hypothetical protein